jgi:hypothetical protein
MMSWTGAAVSDFSCCCCCWPLTKRSSINLQLLLLISTIGGCYLVLLPLLIFAVGNGNHQQMQQNSSNKSLASFELMLTAPSAAASSHFFTWTRLLMTRKQMNVAAVNNSNDRIFFHETSGRMELSFRQNCAVESAALHNPQRPVQIFFQPQQQKTTTTSTIDQSSAWFRALSHYSNVQLIVIDDEQLYFKDSPLEDWYRRGEWHNSPYRVQHMSDYIRILSLYKEGGMYLDLDTITLRPYDGRKFRNFVVVASEMNDELTNAIFHLETDHRLVSAILQVQLEDYDPNGYIYNGPQAITEALRRICDDRTINNKKTKDDAVSADAKVTTIQCPDVQILTSRFFFPVGSPFWYLYFEDANTFKMYQNRN